MYLSRVTSRPSCDSTMSLSSSPCIFLREGYLVKMSGSAMVGKDWNGAGRENMGQGIKLGELEASYQVK